jgi:hypothetical protein
MGARDQIREEDRTATLKPSAANRRAAAALMPLPPAVTTATFRSSFYLQEPVHFILLYAGAVGFKRQSILATPCAAVEAGRWEVCWTSERSSDI